MKRKFLSGVLGLALVQVASGQTASFYVNDGIVTTPPQVDALNFINNGTISLFGIFDAFETANTLTYTNRGLLDSIAGFRFDTYSTQTGLRRPASVFINQATGTINSGLFGLGIPVFPVGGVIILESPRITVSATNIINRGTVNLDSSGLMSLKGRSVDLSRGIINLENFTTLTGIGTIFDGHWGVGTTDDIFPAVNFGFFPFTPLHWVTNRFYLQFQQALSLGAARAYVNDVFTGPSNRVVQVAFVQNTNSAFTNLVYFLNGTIVTEWMWQQTNLLTDAAVTNHMFLFDAYGSITNNTVKTNGLAAPSTGLRPSFSPTNYTFAFGTLGLGVPAPLGLPPGTFPGGRITNQYSSYQAIFSASASILGEVAGQTFATLPGRVEIEASDHLDLNRARISSVNSLLVKATNHFAGADRARIAAPFISMNLRTTNGFLSVSNLVAPSVPRLEGTVDLWSARWTNVDALNFTNTFHVLFVDSRLATAAPAQFHGLTLRTDDLRIHDVLNVVSNVVIEAERLTIATNAPGSPNPAGQINLLDGQIFWPSSTPRLSYLTNDGVIQTFNAVFFGGSRTQPFFSTTFNTNYEAFVNRGTVNNQGSLVWAKHFENHGLFLSGNGSFSLEQNQTARLTNGAILAPFGDVAINSGSLTMSNAIITAGRSLTLAVTNELTDSGATNSSSWSVGDGFNLLARPPVGDLLGTTILSSAPQFVETFNRWAGEDRGGVAAGFTNNVAIGRLILDGENDSQHTFTGTSTGNALYVDYLELRNYITNRNTVGDYIGLMVEPNMKVYFAEAVVNGVSIAAKLDGQNGGRLRWVPDYAGFYSSTNVIYPDGSTNVLNTALVVTLDLDSDCDGQLNGNDISTPVLLVTTAVLPDATNNTVYTTQLQAFGGPSSPYTWTLSPGSTALPAGLSLSPGGVISGTPTQSGIFAFTVQSSVNSPCGPVTADRDLSLTVQPGSLALSVAIVHHSPPGAQVTWKTTANAANFVYYRNSMVTGDWQLLTNFVSSVSGPVSVWDPVGTNQSRYYRVQVSSPAP